MEYTITANGTPLGHQLWRCVSRFISVISTVKSYDRFRQPLYLAMPLTEVNHEALITQARIQ